MRVGWNGAAFVSPSLSSEARKDAAVASAGTAAERPLAMLPAWPIPAESSWAASVILRPESLSSSSLHPAQLASSVSTILVTAGLLRILNLRAQSRRVASAAARMSVQLVVMGTFVLTPLFSFVAASPPKIAAWISVVAALAAREAVSRSKYTYRGQMGDCFVAILGGVGLTLVHLVTCVLRPPFPPSASRTIASAETIVPIAGMLFGSALSATSLGMAVLMSNFLEGGRERVELRLSRGANVWEAALPAVREAVEAALMPTVNAMAAAGIIFMPGMMTGQILGGSSPSQAAAYQLMIYFAIAASRTLTSIFLALILTARMFDLRRQALIPWRWIPGLMASKKSGDARGMNNQFSEPRPHSKFSFIEQAGTFEKPLPPLLRVQQLTVESTNLFVPLLEVHAGDRIGISGRSGIGKSQLLRALSRLDPLSPDRKTIDTGDITFLGKSLNEIPPAEWRSEVMWVPQDRPTISGTPRDFYEEILSYRSHRLSKKKENDIQHVPQQSPITPMEIAREWNLPAKTWDQPWNDVSGGEAQRLSLAIALSLGPKLLLLDEPTSSCDVNTTLKIERTLIERNATIVMVSHSDEQLQRLCCDKLVRLSLSIPC